MLKRKWMVFLLMTALLMGGCTKVDPPAEAAPPPAESLPESSWEPSPLPSEEEPVQDVIDPLEEAAKVSASGESEPSRQIEPEEEPPLIDTEVIPDTASISQESDPPIEQASSSEEESVSAEAAEEAQGDEVAQVSAVEESSAESSEEGETLSRARMSADLTETEAETETEAVDVESVMDTDPIEENLLALVNGERVKNNLPELGMEDTLRYAARLRAVEAVDSLSHNRPDGTPYHSVFDETGFDYAGKWHGENLAMISVDAAEYDEQSVAQAILEEWIGSSGHYLNLLGDGFVQTGIGVYVREDGDQLRIGAAQLFCSL